jgi:hypothetical protein
MSDNFILIKDQADGKAVATTDSQLKDWNQNTKHIQLQAQASRKLFMFDASRYASYKDTSRGLVEQMLNPVFDIAADYGLVADPFQALCWTAGDNTDSGDDEAYLIGGADNRCHMLNLSDPLNPSINLDYFPTLPVEIGNAIAGTCRYQSSIYVLGLTGRICSRPTYDTSSAWTLYAIEWGTFTKKCSLVKSRDSGSGNRWFVLEQGAYMPILTSSNLNNNTPDEGNNFSYGDGGGYKGAILHWCRYEYRVMLFSLDQRQAYTWEQIPQQEWEGWQEYGNQFNYDCSEWAGLEEMGDYLYIFTGMYGGGSYATLYMDDGDLVWNTTQPNGYLQSMAVPFYAGFIGGGNPQGDNDYLIMSGGFSNEGIDTNPSLQILMKLTPPILFDLVDCRDMTKVKCTLRANGAEATTAVTFTPILFDEVERPIILLPSVTISRPAEPFTADNDYEIWGSTEWDVSGATFCGVFIDNVTPGDEENGEILLFMSAI